MTMSLYYLYNHDKKINRKWVDPVKIKSFEWFIHKKNGQILYAFLKHKISIVFYVGLWGGRCEW